MTSNDAQEAIKLIVNTCQEALEELGPYEELSAEEIKITSQATVEALQDILVEAFAKAGSL